MSFADYLDMWWSLWIRLGREIVLAVVQTVGLVALGIQVVSGWIALRCANSYKRVQQIQPGTPEAFKLG